MNKSNENCKGCVLYIGVKEVRRCKSFLNLDPEDCPCQTCLVKVVCRQSCPEVLDSVVWTGVKVNHEQVR